MCVRPGVSARSLHYGQYTCERCSSSRSSCLSRAFEITCRGLLGLDFSKPGEYQKFLESGVWKEKCEKYVQYTIEKLYEFEDEKSADKAGQ